MWPRLRVIRFDVVVPPERRDGTLPDRLKRRRRGDPRVGCARASRLPSPGARRKPAEVMLATADYRQKSDHLGRFIVEPC